MTELTPLTANPPATIKLTDTAGNEVEVAAEFVFGEAGDEKPIPFSITGELFYAAADINADDYGKLAALLGAANKLSEAKGEDHTAELLELVADMVELFVQDESVERLAARLSSKERPIGPVRLMEVVNTFLGHYMPSDTTEGDATRPTQPTSD
jgi:hypothetical protein